jgi:phosphoribosylformimino-5-aminoimidazole carboxamide ribotide isomerase
MLIIPAIDIRGGKCVRLCQGDYMQETVYSEDPVKIAKKFEEDGAQMLHVVDLDGARSGYPLNLPLAGEIAQAVKIPVQFGGGIRSLDIARRALDGGLHRVVIGSKLIDSPEFAEAVFAILGESAAAGIDSRDNFVATCGWTQMSNVGADELIRRMELLGARRFVITDINRDGAMGGPNIDFLYKMSHLVKGRVIVSGGVSTLQDLQAIHALGLKNLEGVIVGTALYQGKLDLGAAVKHFAAAQSPHIPNASPASPASESPAEQSPAA